MPVIGECVFQFHSDLSRVFRVCLLFPEVPRCSHFWDQIVASAGPDHASVLNLGKGRVCLAPLRTLRLACFLSLFCASSRTVLIAVLRTLCFYIRSPSSVVHPGHLAIIISHPSNLGNLCSPSLGSTLVVVHRTRLRLREEVDILNHLSKAAAASSHGATSRHPNVLAYVDNWEQDEALYIRTELCELGNFAHFLWEYGRAFPKLDEARVWKILADLSNVSCGLRVFPSIGV